MKKIPTLFVRLPGHGSVTEQVTPGLEGVLAGEFRPTVKWDGTACLWRDGQLCKRYDAKAGRVPPATFSPAQEAPDPITGHWPGWVPVGDGPEDQWHREGLTNASPYLSEVTYELIGPKIQGNPYRLTSHFLWSHGAKTDSIPAGPWTFDSLLRFLDLFQHEGIVWWGADGPVAKLKRRDFGLVWPIQKEAESKP